MEIILENKTLHHKNDINEINLILSEIEKEANANSMVVSALIIDNVEIHNEYYNYILNNISTIEKIIVVTTSYIELINDTIRSAFEYLKGAPTQVEELADSFYKTPDNESWNELANLLEGIGWIIDVYSVINSNEDLNQYVKYNDYWNKYEESVRSLNNLLPDFEQVLSNEDTISIADILSYEIRPEFEVMADSLSSVLAELE